MSRQTLVACISVVLLVMLYGYTEIDKERGFCRQNDRQQAYGGDIKAFAGELLFGGNYTWLLHVILSSFGQSKVERRKFVDKIFVDKSGCGDTRTVQEAVDAVEGGNKRRVTIDIAAGTYVEKVLVPINKPCITLQGQGMENTIIAWNDNANATNSTYCSASVAIEADHFIAHNISFKNTAPRPGAGSTGAQAVALRVMGDKVGFYGCGMFGYQDTLSDHQGRHFFSECHIEGMVDFIFGNARSLYKKCIIMSNADNWGIITAQSRSSSEEVTGFSFVNCSIAGTGKVFLGRPWRSYSRVVFASTHMDNLITSRGWDDWRNISADATVFYGEYMNTGPGADMAGRVAYVKALSSEEAALYTHLEWINGSDWLHPTSLPLVTNLLNLVPTFFKF